MLAGRKAFSSLVKRTIPCFHVALKFSTVCDHPQVLPSKEDAYNGVIVDSSALPLQLDNFSSSLKHSLVSWKENGRRGVWLKIPIHQSNMIPEAVEQGFIFHHAEAGYVMLVQWLPNSVSHLPANATHQVGVGCVLVNDGKMLVVQERRGALRGTGVWKLPTGLIDAGEDLGDAAERETFEETGVESVFKGVLGIRHMHSALFGKSDLFFICLLEAKSLDITIQEREIAAVEWQDINAYLAQPRFNDNPLYDKVNELIVSAADSSSKGCALDLTKFPVVSYFTGKKAETCLYHPKE